MDEIKEPLITADNISFKYQDRAVLKNLSFSIAAGEHVGIIGESGCGKSTLLKLLAGLLRVSDGELCVAGEKEPERIIRKISMVMQDAQLMPLTIYENITLGHDISEERLEELLSAVRLTEWISTLKDGADTYLGNSANELSGGQAQRIAIARAMAKNVDIILLDEPASALDKATGDELMEALNRITEGKTVIHVTHHPETLKGYDRILRMEKGEFV